MPHNARFLYQQPKIEINNYLIVNWFSLPLQFVKKYLVLFNNSIGYQLGDLAKQNKWSEERLFKEIIKYKNDEKLQTKLHP